MSTVDEDRLREELRTAVAAATFEGIDPAEVIGAGRRVQRRRRAVYAGALAAVAAVAVAGGVATGVVGPDRAAVPAHRAPLVRDVTARLELSGLSDDKGREAFAGATYAVRLSTGTDGRPRVTYLSVQHPGQPDERLTPVLSEPLPSGPGAVSWWTGAPQAPVIVGIMPAGAKPLLAYDGFVAGGASTGAVGALPGSSYQAFAYAFGTATQARSVSAVVYRDAAGAVLASTGERAVTGSFGDVSGGSTAFAFPGLRVWGALEGGESSFGPLPEHPDGSWFGGTSSTTSSWVLWGAMPAGARSVTATSDSRSTVVEQTELVRLGDLLTVYRVKADGKDANRHVRISWTGADGRSHRSPTR